MPLFLFDQIVESSFYLGFFFSWLISELQNVIELQLSMWTPVSIFLKEFNLWISTSDVNENIWKGKKAIGYFLETR